VSAPTVIVDYGAGNLTSLARGLAAVGATVRIAQSPADLAGAAGVVVPGVGHFAATAALDEHWRRAVLAHVGAGRPLLGICLGMQWLFEGSDEAPDLPGLGVLRGRCRRLQGDVKIPHVGWNRLERRADSQLLDGVAGEAWTYFTHAYAAGVDVEGMVAAARHGDRFAAVVERGPVFGTQYHPEKSGEAGLRQLANFVGTYPFSTETARRRYVPDGAVSVENGDVPLAKRIIACLDVRDGRVVKGVRFDDLRAAGDPAALARRYNAEGIDELVLLDVTATLESRRALAATIDVVSRELFIPLAVGGGIGSLDDATVVIDAGADKVAVNSAALRDPLVIDRIAGRYGSQAVIVAIDAKRDGDTFRVFGRSGTTADHRDAVAWAREAEARGAGEILLTSIDADGTRQGFDCALTAAVSSAVAIPVIASGGAGTPDHFADVFTIGRADAALAASIFHFQEHAIGDLKRMLAARGVAVRQVGGAPADVPRPASHVVEFF
jgi:cyclase